MEVRSCYLVDRTQQSGHRKNTKQFPVGVLTVEAPTQCQSKLQCFGTLQEPEY